MDMNTNIELVSPSLEKAKTVISSGENEDRQWSVSQSEFSHPNVPFSKEDKRANRRYSQQITPNVMPSGGAMKGKTPKRPSFAIPKTMITTTVTLTPPLSSFSKSTSKSSSAGSLRIPKKPDRSLSNFSETSFRSISSSVPMVMRFSIDKRRWKPLLFFILAIFAASFGLPRYSAVLSFDILFLGVTAINFAAVPLIPSFYMKWGIRNTFWVATCLLIIASASQVALFSLCEANLVYGLLATMTLTTFAISILWSGISYVSTLWFPSDQQYLFLCMPFVLYTLGSIVVPHIQTMWEIMNGISGSLGLIALIGSMVARFPESPQSLSCKSNDRMNEYMSNLDFRKAWLSCLKKPKIAVVLFVFASVRVVNISVLKLEEATRWPVIDSVAMAVEIVGIFLSIIFVYSKRNERRKVLRNMLVAGEFMLVAGLIGLSVALPAASGIGIIASKCVIGLVTGWMYPISFETATELSFPINPTFSISLLLWTASFFEMILHGVIAVLPDISILVFISGGFASLVGIIAQFKLNQLKLGRYDEDNSSENTKENLVRVPQPGRSLLDWMLGRDPIQWGKRRK